jgi:hypothetical protein
MTKVHSLSWVKSEPGLEMAVDVGKHHLPNFETLFLGRCFQQLLSQDLMSLQCSPSFPGFFNSCLSVFLVLNSHIQHLVRLHSGFPVIVFILMASMMCMAGSTSVHLKVLKWEDYIMLCYVE